MDLVFIHGPPAVGKLTVAKELAKLTQYKVFHNHLSNDLVGSIFEFGKGPFWKIAGDVKLGVLETAAKQNIEGVIFTYCYSKGKDDADIRRYLRRLKKHNVRFLFVHLHCNKQELLRRVKDPARRQYRKVHKIKTLKTHLQKNDYASPIRHPSTVSIDNTDRSPKMVAKEIKKVFKL